MIHGPYNIKIDCVFCGVESEVSNHINEGWSDNSLLAYNFVAKEPRPACNYVTRIRLRVMVACLRRLKQNIGVQKFIDDR